MKYLIRTPLMVILCAMLALSQTQQPQKPQEEVGADDVVRITTQLVQTDVVVVESFA